MRPEKQLLLDEINTLIDQSCALIITQFSGLNPQVSWNLSEDLSKCNSNFKVMKKRLLWQSLKNLPS